MTITAEDVYALAPFAKTLGVTFGELASGPLTARLPFTPGLSTTHGGLHGGALMGFADVTAAVCAVLNGPPGGIPATVTSSTFFLAPVRGDALAVASPLHVGKSSVTVEVDVKDDSGRLCVRVVQTVAVRPR
ncbi:PaaI family thioesterase [Streptomyces misionensis]|uniref:PaaI family thioesterase n=1 Tax=Streptomyces misionensis TaxID=67331 RepID=UPI0033FB95AE